ncbi:MAG TPA: hypothetical protein VF131_13915 [Blastocatellia bacterium]|nr:hypothetical protein [Blastocatellia bacterium]
MPRRAGAITFEGQPTGDSIIGKIQQGNARGTFHLVRTVTVDPKNYEQYVGDYEVARDRYIFITMSGIGFAESGSNGFGQLFS